MTDKTFEERLNASTTYSAALKAGLIEKASPVTQDELDTILATAKQKLEEATLSDEQQKDFTDDEKAAYQQIQEDVKKKQSPKPVKIETLDDSSPTPPVNENDQWIEKKRAFWAAYAEKIGMELKEPDTNNPNVFEAELTKDGESKGAFRYTSPEKVHVFPKADISVYQGIVADVIANGNTLQLGKTLNNEQQLMLYAAALLADKNGQHIEVLNPPALTDEMEKSAMFKGLPQDVKNVLLAKKKEIHEKTEKVLQNKDKDKKSDNNNQSDKQKDTSKHKSQNTTRRVVTKEEGGRS